MKKTLSLLASTTGIALTFALLSVMLPSHAAHAAVSGWEKGATIIPTSTTDLGTADTFQSIKNLASTGANFVAFELPYYQTKCDK